MHVSRKLHSLKTTSNRRNVVYMSHAAFPTSQKGFCLLAQWSVHCRIVIKRFWKHNFWKCGLSCCLCNDAHNKLLTVSTGGLVRTVVDARQLQLLEEFEKRKRVRGPQLSSFIVHPTCPAPCRPKPLWYQQMIQR